MFIRFSSLTHGQTCCRGLAIEILLTQLILDLLLRINPRDSSHSTPPNLLSRQPASFSPHSELTLDKGLITNFIYSLSSPKPVYRHLLLNWSWLICVSLILVHLRCGQLPSSHLTLVTHLHWFVNIMEAATFDAMRRNRTTLRKQITRATKSLTALISSSDSRRTA